MTAGTLRRPFFLLVLTFGTACSESGSAPEVQVRTGADGVREVLSSAQQPYPEPWMLQRVGSLGVAYGSEEYMLGQPWGLEVFKDGTLVILDGSPLRFRVYDSNGRFVRYISQEGDGPDDIRFRGANQTVLRANGPDRFEYWSGWPYRRQAWSLAGELLEVETMSDRHPLVEMGSPYWRGGIRDRMYALYTYIGRSDSDPRGDHRLWLSDWSGDEAIELFSLRAFDWRGLGALSRGVGMAQAVHDFTPGERLLVSRTGKIYFSDLDEDWIHEFDAETGDEALRFRMVRESPEAIPPSEVSEVRTRLGDEIGDGMAWWSEHLWLFYLAEGPGGEIWVQRTGHADEAGRWPTDVFTPDGRFQGRIHLPFAPFRMRVAGTRIYAITEGAEEEPVVAWFDLRKAGSG